MPLKKRPAKNVLQDNKKSSENNSSVSSLPPNLERGIPGVVNGLSQWRHRLSQNETMKPTTDINNSVHTPVHSTDCDNYRNINDSYVPSPDPEEDWGKTQPQYQESDAELNSTFSDLSETGTNSEDENRFDVFSDLRKLKNENKIGPL